MVKLFYQGKLTKSFLILEWIVSKPEGVNQSVLTSQGKSISESYYKLLEDGYVEREHKNGRYVVVATKKGREEFERLQERWERTVRPVFIN